MEQVFSFNRKVMSNYISGLCKVLGLRSSFATSFLQLIASAMSWYMRYNISPRVIQVVEDTSQLTEDVIQVLNYHSREMGTEIIRELYKNPGKIAGCALSQGLRPIKQLGFFEAEQAITDQTNKVLMDLFTDFLKDVKNNLLPSPGTLSGQLMKRIGIEHTPITIEEKETWKDWFINGMCESAYTTGYIPTGALSTAGCNLEKLTTRSCVELGTRLKNTISKQTNIIIHNIQEHHNQWLENIKPQAEYVAFDAITIVLIFFIITAITSILFKTTEKTYESLRKQTRSLSRKRLG
jgi:hypothetical protein